METTKRKLTDGEIRDWADSIANGADWTGITAVMVYDLMRDTAGNKYDAGEADWDFDITDAERLLALMTEN